MNTAPVTQPAPITQDDFAIRVKVQLLKKGWTVKDLAKLLALHRGTVSTAIHHPSMLLDVKRRIRETLGMEAAE